MRRPIGTRPYGVARIHAIHGVGDGVAEMATDFVTGSVDIVSVVEKTITESERIAKGNALIVQFRQ